MIDTEEMREFLHQAAKNIKLNLLKFLPHRVRNNRINIYIVVEREDHALTGIKECEEINKLAMLWLKNANALSFVNLSIKTPGIDRELFSIQDCARFVSFYVLIELKEIIDGKKNIKGFIKSAECDLIKLENEGEELSINWSSIKKASILPNWEKIMKEAKQKHNEVPSFKRRN